MEIDWLYSSLAGEQLANSCFGKVDLLNPDLAWSIEVDEKGREVNAIRVAPAIAKELFPYVLSGHGSAEIKLTKKIDEFEQLVK